MIATNTIPGYRIIRQLGQGGSATTYLAIQTSFEREVALKIMSPTLNADPTFPMRFVREARIVAQMHHASIVPVFDVGKHPPYHYLSMEYLPGGDLRQRIVEGRSTPALALDVCMAMCSALEVAHRKGFIHRDIKPQNILFREDGAPVLTDFGIARAIDVGTSLTVAGMFVGTPAYMSPEQVKGEELDCRTDLYSLGMVFYEMLTGDVPFRSDSDSALSIAMKHLSETLPTLPPEYSVFQPIIDRLTAKERAERFATATEVLAALRSLNSGQGARVRTLIGSSRDATRETKTMPRAATPRPMPPGLPATAANARKPWLIGAGAGVFGAAIALAFFIAQREPTVEPATTAQQASVPTAPVSDANASTNIVSATLAPTVDEAPVEVVTTPTQNLQPVATMAAVAAPARPRETAAAQRARKIAGLLEQAEQDFSAGALTTPANENAADRYREVLALDADNAQAQAGLRRIGASLVDEVDRARRANELDTAQTALDQARSVQPDHPRLAKLQADIGERRVTLDKRSRKAREKASEHLSRAEQLLARSPLVVKVVADAHDHYDEAAQLTPEDPALDQMKQRIVFGYVVAAQYELNRNEPRRALNVVNYARRRNVATPELETIERTASAVQQQ